MLGISCRFFILQWSEDDENIIILKLFISRFLFFILSNGSKIPIKDIKIGDDVVCFNPETMETNNTKVVNHYVRETEKKMFKIITLSGREIVATEDHKFMTTEGWCEVQNMSINETKIGILPHQQIVENHSDGNSMILSENEFAEIFIKNNY